MHLRGMVVAAAFALLGCKSSADEAPAPSPCGKEEVADPDGHCLPTGVPEGGCAPGFTWAERACTASLPTCGVGTLAVLGEAACHPVGPGPCAKGFTADGEGGCAAVLPKDPCGPLELALPSDTACAPLDTCEALPVSAKGLVFVDASAATGGDGTREKPFSTLAAALAAAVDGDRVLLVDGTYPANVVVDKAVTLSGRCAAKVEIVGVDPTRPVVTLDGGAKLAHLSVTGKGEVGVDAKGTPSLEAVRIHDVEGSGLRTTGASTVTTATRILVDHATLFGVEVAGGRLELASSVVRDTAPRADGQRGIGLSIERPSFGGATTEVHAKDVVLERNADAGILAHACKLVLERAVVRDTKPRADGTFGIGLYALAYSDSKAPAGDVQVSDSLFSGNTYAGVDAAGAVVTLDRVTVRDTKAQTDTRKIGGRGVIVQDHPVAKQPGVATVRRSAILHSREVGAIAASSTLLLEDSLVSDVVKGGDALRAGVASVASVTQKTQGTVTLRRSLVESADLIGVYAFGGVLRVEGSTVRKSRPIEANSGWGIHALPDDVKKVPSELSVEGSVIEDNTQYGVFAFDVPTTIVGTLVRSQRLGASDTSSGAGIVVKVSDLSLGKTTTLDRVVVEDVQELGVFLSGANGTVDGATIRKVTPGPNKYAVGLVGYVFTHDDESTTGGVLAVRHSTLTDLVGSALMVAHVDLDLEDSLVRRVVGVPSYGDALTIERKFGPSVVRMKRVALTDVARAGLLVIGSRVSLSSCRICAQISIDVEKDIDPSTLEDQGGNVCGCDTDAVCSATSIRLEPIALRP